MNQQERMEKIKELGRRNKKSPEFLKRMKYIKAHNFTVRTTDDPTKYTVIVSPRDKIYCSKKGRAIRLSFLLANGKVQVIPLCRKRLKTR